MPRYRYGSQGASGRVHNAARIWAFPWGWSYGGLAAIAVIRRPDVFRAAVSGAAPSMEAAWAGRRLDADLSLGGMAGEDAKLPRPGHDGLGGPMRRGQKLFWTITGSIVAAVAIVIALVLVNSGTPPKTASSPLPSASASASPHANPSAPVVIPETSSTSSFSYLSDLTPSGNLAELVNPGAVKISGSIYPKSISLYCNVGDPTAFLHIS
jgi:hypothetical protein